MNHIRMRFPEGRAKCLTLSYDDGTTVYNPTATDLWLKYAPARLSGQVYNIPAGQTIKLGE